MRKLPKPKNKKSKRLLYRLHKKVGVFSALFVLLLSTTGLLIQHSDGLNLSTSHVSFNWLLDAYGIKVPQTVHHFSNHSISVTQLDTALYFKRAYLIQSESKLIGFLHNEDSVIIVTQNEIILLTPEGELVDTMTSTYGVPTPILKLSTEFPLTIQTPNGLMIGNDQLDLWQKVEFVQSPKWQSSKKLSNEQLRALQNDFRSRTLNWERVFLDLHSGRLFGPLGPLFMDVVAILFIFMAISGIFMWTKKRK